jgi:hypothetical protein
LTAAPAQAPPLPSCSEASFAAASFFRRERAANAGVTLVDSATGILLTAEHVGSAFGEFARPRGIVTDLSA